MQSMSPEARCWDMEHSRPNTAYFSRYIHYWMSKCFIDSYCVLVSTTTISDVWGFQDVLGGNLLILRQSIQEVMHYIKISSLTSNNKESISDDLKLATLAPGRAVAWRYFASVSMRVVWVTLLSHPFLHCH